MEGAGSLQGQELRGKESRELSPPPSSLSPILVRGGSEVPGIRVTSTAPGNLRSGLSGRAKGGVRTAPSGRGRDRRAEQGRAGPGLAEAGLT